MAGGCSPGSRSASGSGCAARTLRWCSTRTTGGSNARSAATTRSARLLVVDDNDDAAQSLALALRLEGHEVETAADGEAALRLLDRFAPAAAILDIGLPRMNGYELAAALRADPRARGVVLIALTGYGRGPDRRRALDAGFDEHLVKPVEFDKLLARLAELHGRSLMVGFNRRFAPVYTALRERPRDLIVMQKNRQLSRLSRVG